MDYLIYIGILLLTVAGGAMYRWRGMNEADVPSIFKNRTLRRVMCCLIIALSAWIYGFGADMAVYWVIPACLVLAFPGIVVGHGSYFSRKYWPEDQHENVDNEKFAFITRLIADPMNHRARWIGMALTGLATTVLIGAFGWYMGSFVLMAFAPVGFLKAFIYDIESLQTEKAEIVWGAVVSGAMPLIWLFTTLQ